MSPAAPAAEIDRLLESRDFEGCLGYLSRVSGIDSALLYNHEGWVMASGDESHEEAFIEGPYLLSQFQETLRHFKNLGLGPMEQSLVMGGQKFFLVVNLDRTGLFFLVVSGVRGSYDLYKHRVERGVQALGALLRERGYLRGG